MCLGIQVHTGRAVCGYRAIGIGLAGGALAIALGDSRHRGAGDKEGNQKWAQGHGEMAFFKIDAPFYTNAGTQIYSVDSIGGFLTTSQRRHEKSRPNGRL